MVIPYLFINSIVIWRHLDDCIHRYISCHLRQLTTTHIKTKETKQYCLTCVIVDRPIHLFKNKKHFHSNSISTAYKSSYLYKCEITNRCISILKYKPYFNTLYNIKLAVNTDFSGCRVLSITPIFLYLIPLRINIHIPLKENKSTT